MDKKQLPRAEPQTKKQDVSSSKPWPRSSKKRESTTNNAPAKENNGNNRRQLSARGKSFDKRPRPRGGGCHALAAKAETRLDQDQDAEVGSVFLPGSKKHNLNHLLNFHYAPRDGGHNQPTNRKHHGLVCTNSHKHNKELFLQSNCQFVVRAGGDYAPYMIDPDIPISWDVIEQINVRVNGPLNCPICLGETIAGRITKCGHTYCWPCLLHYFALSESPVRPCPICFQPIDKINLKSVQGIWQSYTPVGEDIQMRLMRRVRGSTVVEVAPPLDTVDAVKINNHHLPSISIHGTSSVFAKLLTASPEEVNAIINRERSELNEQLSPELEHPQFILEALHFLQLRENRSQAPTKERDRRESENSHCSGEPDIFAFDSHNCDSSSSMTGSTVSNSNLENVNEECNGERSSVDKYFYFYQATDGQATFLHGLNNRIVEATWGSLSMAPRELHGNILERASGSVGLEARRRLRCLQHLPIHCPYDLVEIHLRPPFVSQEALNLFKNDLDERKRLRQKRARDEKRREKVINHKEQLIMGHMPGLEININSEEHFPAYQPEVEASPSSSDWKWDKESSSSSTSSSVPKQQESSSLSFAKMASTTGVWKVRQVAETSMSSSHHQADDSDDELGIPPAYNLSLGDAITEALLNTSLASNEGAPKEGKKKKKFKPKVLFTTGIQHHTANG